MSPFDTGSEKLNSNLHVCTSTLQIEPSPQPYKLLKSEIKLFLNYDKRVKCSIILLCGKHQERNPDVFVGPTIMSYLLRWWPCKLAILFQCGGACKESLY